MSDPVAEYGWTALPRDTEKLLAQRESTKAPEPILVESVKLPDSKLAKEVLEYAKKELPIETLHHCMRVYYYGMAIVSQSLPSWSTPSFNETYFLTCLLHDIGTTDTNMTATHLSFEFYGGYLALDLLKSLSTPIAQAESVTEAIIRHQDLGTTGTLTKIGGLIQLATIFDNMGGHPELVNRETIISVVGAWPRMKWSSCFAYTIRKENGHKPWAHTTHLGEEDFPNGVMGNKLMEEFEIVEMIKENYHEDD